MSEIIVGNMAKCRDALVEVNGALDNIMDYDVDGVLHRCVSIIKQALAEPPRNCDVGSAEEQTRRFRRYCDMTKCEYCELRYIVGACSLKWAQMPYEEGGKK